MKKLSFLLLLFLWGCEDPEIAKIRKEAENGNAIAQFNLGEQYYNGGKLKQDHNIGISWYEKSAQQENMDAIIKLTNIYVSKKEYEKAIIYIEKICSYNRKEKLCKNKENIEKDYLLHQIEEYANNNDIENLIKYGANYTDKYKHIYNDKHEKKLYQIMKEASKQEDPKVLNFLAWMYEVPYGTEKDYKLAREFYEKASKSGFDLATYNLARFYHYGKGVLKDHLKAKSLYEKVSDQNKKRALYQIGIMDICNSFFLWNADESYRLSLYQTDPSRKYIINSCNLGYESACYLDNKETFADNSRKYLCDREY